MAFFEMKYHSDALKMGVSVNVILPETAKTMIGMKSEGESKYKTLYLFHGLSDDHSIWMRRTSIERYAAEYGIAVVMPSVGRSWYTDTAGGANYLTFVTKELPAVCRSYFNGMSAAREDNIVAGLSMGGYGAIKAALTCPETYGACASLSGALDVSIFSEITSLAEFRATFGFSLDSSEQLRGTDKDVFALATKNKETLVPFPKLYLWCGEDDFLLNANRKFKSHLDQLGVKHKYEESEGNHSWKWWDMHICDALNYFLK